MHASKWGACERNLEQNMRASVGTSWLVNSLKISSACVRVKYQNVSITYIPNVGHWMACALPEKDFEEDF